MGKATRHDGGGVYIFVSLVFILLHLWSSFCCIFGLHFVGSSVFILVL